MFGRYCEHFTLSRRMSWLTLVWICFLYHLSCRVEFGGTNQWAPVSADCSALCTSTLYCIVGHHYPIRSHGQHVHPQYSHREKRYSSKGSEALSLILDYDVPYLPCEVDLEGADGACGDCQLCLACEYGYRLHLLHLNYNISLFSSNSKQRFATWKPSHYLLHENSAVNYMSNVHNNFCNRPKPLAAALWLAIYFPRTTLFSLFPAIRFSQCRKAGLGLLSSLRRQTNCQ